MSRVTDRMGTKSKAIPGAPVGHNQKKQRYRSWRGRKYGRSLK